MSGDTKHELLHVLRLTNLSAMQGAKWLLRLHHKRIPAGSTNKQKYHPPFGWYFCLLTSTLMGTELASGTDAG
jgi:hypothetical protein